MKIAVIGATGLVGRRLVQALTGRGDEVVAVGRDASRVSAALGTGVRAAAWNVGAPESLASVLTGLDAVVNLAGSPLFDRRWNRRVRAEIRDSRVEGTHTVARAIGLASPRPTVLVSASAVGYYGPRGAEAVDESEPPGGDFLAEVCVDWEAAARGAEVEGVRVALPRIGIVLDSDGGALPRMLPPFCWFVGGPIGHGRQGFPWIHRDDLTGLLLFLLDSKVASGPVNATAPEPPTNREFCRALGRAIRRPSWLPAPRPALRLVLGPVAKVVTTGVRAVPRRALDWGYEFRFPDAEAAIVDLLGTRAS